METALDSVEPFAIEEPVRTSCVERYDIERVVVKSFDSCDLFGNVGSGHDLDPVRKP